MSFSPAILLEHPTAVEMLDNPAMVVLGAAANHPETGEPVCYDVVGYYAAKHTSVTLSNNFTIQLCYENDQLNDDPGTPARIIFHWSAGNYNQCWNGYQFGVVYDKSTGKAYAIRFLSYKQKGKHLWARNTGSVGISLMAMADGEPVQHAQLMIAARLAAEYCCWHNINPRASETVAQKTCDQPNCNSIWDTGKMIQMKVINDHRTYAIADDYSQFRIDIGAADMQIVTAEMLRIYDALKRHDPSESFQMLAIIKSV